MLVKPKNLKNFPQNSENTAACKITSDSEVMDSSGLNLPPLALVKSMTNSSKINRFVWLFRLSWHSFQVSLSFGRVKQPLKWISDFRMVLWVNLWEDLCYWSRPHCSLLLKTGLKGGQGWVIFRPVNSAVLFWAEDSGEMKCRRDAAARLIHATYI